MTLRLGVFRKGAELRRAYQVCVDLAKTRRPSAWLADTSKFQVLDPADAKWVAEWFWPEFAKAGVPRSYLRRWSARCR